jgi:hypothetical protein
MFNCPVRHLSIDSTRLDKFLDASMAIWYPEGLGNKLLCVAYQARGRVIGLRSTEHVFRRITSVMDGSQNHPRIDTSETFRYDVDDLATTVLHSNSLNMFDDPGEKQMIADPQVPIPHDITQSFAFWKNVPIF